MRPSEIPGPVVHLWVSQTLAQSALPEQSHFSDEELARANALKNLAQQSQLLYRRAFVRNHVAPVFGLSPESCSVIHRPTGQPVLSCRHSGREIYLSITTANNYFAIAASDDAAVGIDLESTIQFDLDLARRILSPTEQARLAACPMADASIFLSSSWTQKEAYLKTIGTGLVTEPGSITLPTFNLAQSGHWQAIPCAPQYQTASWALQNHLLSLCVCTTTSPHLQCHTNILSSDRCLANV
ncbi:MAG TPA: 4'-phosphopantetheinyl transferase superfamily protein [Tepidisphaeraceae bacterium]|jgi:4'-phosphopantetheinyl transferase